MNWSAFRNGFFKGLAAPCALAGMFSPEYSSPHADTPPQVKLDDVIAELNEVIPPKTILDDMAAVHGDFIQALGRM